MWWISLALAADPFATLAQPGPKVVCDLEVSSDGAVHQRTEEARCPDVGKEAAAELLRVAPTVSVGTWPHVARVEVEGEAVVGVRLVTGRQRVRLRALPVARVTDWVPAQVFAIPGSRSCEVEVSVSREGIVQTATSSCGVAARAAELAASAWRFEPVSVAGSEASAWRGSIVVPIEWMTPGTVEPLGLPAPNDAEIW